MNNRVNQVLVERSIAIALLTFVTGLGCSQSNDILDTHDDQRQHLTAPVTASFRNGAAPTASYAGSTDATIRQAYPSTNYGNATTCRASGNEFSGSDLACLLRWDVTSIPRGSAIQSASITLRAVGSTAQVYQLYAVLRSWNESEVTWQRAGTLANWQSGGAQGALDRGGLVGTLTGSGAVTVPLNANGVALVQSWLEDSANHGVILAHTSNSDTVDVASSEYGTISYRPALTVTYVPPDPVDAGDAGSDGPTSGDPSMSFVARGATWRFRADGSNQGTAWRSPAFDDTSWSLGPAELGYGEGDEATVIPSGSRYARYVTSYFRRQFEVADPIAVTSLSMSIERDDGAIVYLNGAEVYRTNMPTGTVTYATLASATSEGGAWFTAAVPVSRLAMGTNIIAVELHQRSRTDTDASFDFELTGTVRQDGGSSGAGGAGGAAGAGGASGSAGASGSGGQGGSGDQDASAIDAGTGGAAGSGGAPPDDGAAGAGGSAEFDASNDALDDHSSDTAEFDASNDALDDDSNDAANEGGADVAPTEDAADEDGGRPGTTDENLLVAFIGDQGNTANADAVLALIQREGASATVHLGDFDYADNPAAWNARIDGILGPDYPYFAVVGNHDALAWSGASGYASFIAARQARIPAMDCQGELGVRATCRFHGLYLVESCIGTSELRADCAKDSPGQVQFIRDSLANDGSLFSMCLWHKNQSDMQLGTKTDEVGWTAYSECMNAGAIIATAHEHSYGRTKTLTNVGNASTGHGAIGEFNVMQLSPGQTFVLVSGIGGDSLRAYDPTRHDDDTWWASYYASNRWRMNGVAMTGTAAFGALFIRFHVDGNPRLARGYFKDVNDRVADEFTIEIPQTARP